MNLRSSHRQSRRFRTAGSPSVNDGLQRDAEGWRVAQTLPNAVILGADTLVAIDDHIIGKPADLEEARQILAALSGRSHSVWTAVCVCQLALGKSLSLSSVSQVEFHDLTDRAIKSYLAKITRWTRRGRTPRKDTEEKSSSGSTAPTATSSVADGDDGTNASRFWRHEPGKNYFSIARQGLGKIRHCPLT